MQKYHIYTVGPVHWKATMAAILSTGYKYWNGKTNVDEIFNEEYQLGFDKYIIFDTFNRKISCCDSSHYDKDDIQVTLEEALIIITKSFCPKPLYCRAGIVYSNRVIIGIYTLTHKDIIQLAEAIEKINHEQK